MHNATYGDLERTLLELGFSVSCGVNEFGFPVKSYDNVEHDAWIMLRSIPGEELLKPVDLRKAERTVVWKGIADSKKFHKLLETQDTRVPARAA